MILHRACASLVLALWAGIAPAGDRAVVVGIDRYQALGLAGATGTASADALDFRDHLERDLGFAPDEITVLLNEEATADAIIDTLLGRLVSETEAGDRAVFYFAGLGSRRPWPDSGEADGLEEILLAYDLGGQVGFVTEKVLADILDLLPDRAVTVMIDAGHTAPRNTAWDGPGRVLPRAIDWAEIEPPDRSVLRASPVVPALPTFLEPPFGTGTEDRDVWAAAAPSQTAWAEGGRGLFTQSYLRGVSGRADLNGNGIITNAELLRFMREEGERWCEAEAACREMAQGLSPHFRGEPSRVLPVSVSAAVEAEPGGAADAGAPPRPARDAPQIAPPAVPRPEPGTALFEQPAAYALAFVTDLFAPVNDANLSLSMTPSTAPRIGDEVTFYVSSDIAGTLILLNVNPAGELIKVFPSVLSRPGAYRIAAGETRAIPESVGANGLPLRVRVTGPPGRGVLLALLVEADLPAIEAILPANLSGTPIPDARRYLLGIADSLLSMQADATGNRPVDWSATFLTYRVGE